MLLEALQKSEQLHRNILNLYESRRVRRCLWQHDCRTIFRNFKEKHFWSRKSFFYQSEGYSILTHFSSISDKIRIFDFQCPWKSRSRLSNAPTIRYIQTKLYKKNIKWLPNHAPFEYYFSKFIESEARVSTIDRYGM